MLGSFGCVLGCAGRGRLRVVSSAHCGPV